MNKGRAAGQRIQVNLGLATFVCCVSRDIRPDAPSARSHLRRFPSGSASGLLRVSFGSPWGEGGGRYILPNQSTSTSRVTFPTTVNSTFMLERVKYGNTEITPKTFFSWTCVSMPVSMYVCMPITLVTVDMSIGVFGCAEVIRRYFPKEQTDLHSRSKISQKLGEGCALRPCISNGWRDIRKVSRTFIRSK